MTSAHLARASVAVLLAVAAVLTFGATTTFASAASATMIEAEAMTALSGTTKTYASSAASGGAAVRISTNGTLAGTVTTRQADRLALRLRGDQFQGAPRAVVRVDGVRVATFTVSATAWTRYAVTGAWGAGPHEVRVAYTNDHRVAGVGDRNLRVDRVTFKSSATPVPTVPPTPTPTPAPGGPDDAYEARIVQLVNAERAKARLAPLSVSPCADSYAEAWSATMARTGAFEHRADLAEVLRACSARAIGENIAYGSVTADQMMALWMGSAGHRANILNPTFTHIGVGAVTTSSGRVYGTQNFLTL